VTLTLAMNDNPHTITAKASDGFGNSTVSAGSLPVTIDSTNPTVTINQGASQADPTNTSPVVFDVVFSEDVTGFTSAGVSISGTATHGTVTVTPGIDAAHYTVSVPVTGDGTIIADVIAGAAQDAAGNDSTASTSTDHTVTYDTTPPTVSINQKVGQADP